MDDQNTETQEPEATPAPAGPEMLEIDISEPKEEPEPEPSRQEKKNQRGHQLFEQTKAELDSTRQQMDAMERRHADEMAMVRREMARVVPQERTDELQQQIDQKYEERDSLYTQLNDNVPKEKIQEILQKGRKLEQEAMGLVVKKDRRDNTPPAMDPQAQAIRTQYADVFADKKAIARASGLLAIWNSDGHPSSVDLFAKALEEAREWKKNGGRGQKPNPSDQARLRGNSPGAPATDTTSTIRIPLSEKASLQRMADTVYAHIDGSPESQKKHGFTGDASEHRLKKYLQMLRKKG